MPLSPPVLNPSYPTLPDLLRAVNEHAGPEGYAVVLRRTKKSRQGVLKKAWIICDRGRKSPGPVGHQLRHSSSRHVGCPFKIIAIVEEGTRGPWFPEIQNESHCHGPSEPGAHPVLRRMAMTSDLRSEIARQLATQVAPSQILSSLRVNDPTAQSAMVTQRDIYNIGAQQRREKLGPFTPIQALIQEFNAGNWVYELQKDAENEITHLFFTKGTSQEILAKNHEILIIDCTYKTNRFKMPLMVISGQTALHTTFYVAFAFFAKEETPDYTWVMDRIKALYVSSNLSDPVAIVTDMEQGLMNAISVVFPHPGTYHLLCTLNICNNVAVNCKKQFATAEAWEIFFSAWKKVMYADSEREYQAAWDAMNNSYIMTHTGCMEYLWDTYLRDHCRRFVQCYTNQALHFGNTVISRAKGGHAVLNKQLGNSTGDVKKVADEISLLLTNQIHNHSLAMASAQLRYPTELRLPIFQELAAHVTPYALRLIFPQYKLVTERSTALTSCTKVFSTTTGLPCSHQIQERLYRNENLMLEDVHIHWR